MLCVRVRVRVRVCVWVEEESVIEQLFRATFPVFRSCRTTCIHVRLRDRSLYQELKPIYHRSIYYLFIYLSIFMISHTQSHIYIC